MATITIVIIAGTAELKTNISNRFPSGQRQLCLARLPDGTPGGWNSVQVIVGSVLRIIRNTCFARE